MTSRHVLAAVGVCLVSCSAPEEEAALDAPIEPSIVEQSLQEARQHVRAGRPREAAAACERGLAADSTHAQLANLLATVEAGRGRYAPAIAALERALRHHPDMALLHLNLGAMHYKLGDFGTAEEYLLQSAQLQPGQSSVQRRLAELYLASDRPAAAIRHARRALELFPDDGTLTYYLGRAYEESGDLDGARSQYREAVRLDIGFTEAWYRLAVLERRGGDRDEADRALWRFRRLQGIGNGDPDVPKELDKLRAAVLNAPEDAVHHFSLGAFFAQHEFLDEAENRLRRAATLEPGNTQMLNDSARLLARQRAHEEALRFYDLSLAIDSTQVEALLGAGNLRTLQGQTERGKQLFERILTQTPSHAPARFYYALALLREERVEAALSELRQALTDAQQPALRQQIQRVLDGAAVSEAP